MKMCANQQCKGSKLLNLDNTGMPEGTLSQIPSAEWRVGTERKWWPVEGWKARGEGWGGLSWRGRRREPKSSEGEQTWGWGVAEPAPW